LAAVNVNFNGHQSG